MDEIPDVSFALVVTLCCKQIVGDLGQSKCPFCGERLRTTRYTRAAKLQEEVIQPISADEAA